MLPTFTNGFWTPKMLAWLLGGSSLVALQWTLPTRARPRPPGSWWLAALFAWVSLQFIGSNVWPWLWLHETADRFPYHWSISMIIPSLTFFLSVLVWRALVQATDSPQRWVRLGVQVCAYATVIAVYGLVQQVGLDPLIWVFQGAPGSLGTHVAITVFGNPMLTANCLAICAPLCLVFKPRWCRLSYGLMLLCLLCMGKSRSTMSLFAFLLGSSVIWVYRRQWHWLLGAWGAALAGVGWLALTHQLSSFLSFSGRWAMWSTVLTVWTKQPWYAWMGYYLGAVESATANRLWNYGSLHCEPLQILFELGVVGFVLSAGAVWQFLTRIVKAPKDTLLMGWLGSALSYALIACTSFPFRVGTLLMLGVLIVAALESLMEDTAHAYPA